MADSLGEALLLGQTGDIQITERSDGSRTLRRIEGPEEVQQALQIMLSTIEGENVLFPDYGVPVLDFMGPFNEALAEAILRDDVVLDEPRVSSVESVTAEYEEDADRATRVITSDIKARLVNAENVSVTAMFGV